MLPNQYYSGGETCMITCRLTADTQAAGALSGIPKIHSRKQFRHLHFWKVEDSAPPIEGDTVAGGVGMKIRNRWLTWAAAAMAVGLTKLLFATCRKVYLGINDRTKLSYVPGPDDDHRYVLCLWHDVLLIPTFAAPRRLREKTCCLVSQHQDGSYLANAMSLMGYSTVRGSSRRGGAQAVRQLLEDTAGKHIVITPDGPGGPRRQLKAGVVYIASQLGRDIVPGAFSVTSAWRPKGRWTDMVIPKPFSTIYVAMGTPISVPADIRRDQLDQYVAQVQAEMDRFSAEIEGLVSGPVVTEPEESVRRAA